MLELSELDTERTPASAGIPSPCSATPRPPKPEEAPLDLLVLPWLGAGRARAGKPGGLGLPL